MPKFSIIMPAYNSAPWLKSAIASLQSQVFSDWEVIVSDDASTDGTVAIATEISRLDNRVRVVTRNDGINRGAAAARNFGLDFALGEYVGFLDCDDEYNPECLEIVFSLFSQTQEIGVVYGRTRWIDLSGEVIVEEKLGFAAGRVYPPPYLALNVIIGNKGAVPCTCAFFAKLSSVRACGGFEEQFRLYEDQTLWLKLLLHENALLSGAVLGRYRQHPHSTSAKAAAAGVPTDGQANRVEPQFLHWAQSEFAKTGVSEDVFRAAFHDRMWPYRNPVRAYLKRKARRIAKWMKRCVANGTSRAFV